jgi:glycosyltransferase involved in cell wall biosynthesis
MTTPRDLSIFLADLDQSKPFVIIDGRRLTQHSTGVGRYLNILLNQWATQSHRLAFQPIVVKHKRDSVHHSTANWGSNFPEIILGEKQPGWIWENLSLAAKPFRSLPLFAPANLIPFRWNGPVLLVIHDTFCELPHSGISRINRLRFRGRYRRAAHRATSIIVPSQATATDVKQYFQVPDQRIQIIPPGIPDSFQPLLPQKSLSEIQSNFKFHRPYVLFVGKKSGRRNFDKILDAVQKLNQQGHEIDLISVGPSSGKFPKMQFWNDLGYVSDMELISLYQKALALIWPSQVEGFGLPVAEAMATGCPVITTPTGAIQEVTGNCCIGLKSNNPNDMFEAILTLKNQPEQRKKLIEDGHNRIQSRFSVESFAQSVSHVLMKMIQESSHHRL